MLPHSFRYLVLTVFSLTLILWSTGTASACSCGPRPTILEAFDAADEVVIVRGLSVEKVEDAKKERYVDGIRSATMIVDKVFKGKLNVREEIVFGQGGGADCIWTFDEQVIGKQALFYLVRPEKLAGYRYLPSQQQGVWLAFECGRSRELPGATEDLRYLENLDKVRGKTRISGTLGGFLNPDLPVDGKTIKIIGPKKTYVTKTDENGVFEIYDLPPGKYFVEPEIPKGWKIDIRWVLLSLSGIDRKWKPDTISPKQIEIMLEAKKHVSLQISFEPDNFIRGRVLGPKGSPTHNVCVYLLPPGKDEGPLDYTDKLGRFEIRSIPPGDYVLVANRSDRASDREPFPRIFYPGVSERERAVVLNIDAGETIENLDIVVPKLKETIIIKGVLRYSDGNPVAEEWVRFKVTKNDEKVYGEVNGKTDSEGRFTLRVLKGLTGELASAELLWKSQYKDCSKLDELLAKSGEDNVTIYTNIIELTTEHDLYDVELTFPFPRCKKAKE